tara:strand:- start:37883 stop:38266 length:384 start_codon:yes stop_codon:yes gene_type:complete
MIQIPVTNPVNLIGNNFSMAFRGDEMSKNVKAKEEVQLVDSQGQELTYATVLDIWAGPLGHYPALLAEMMQNPLCRTFTGLHTELMLQRASDKETTPLTTVITILILEPKTSTILRATPNQIAKGGV